MYNVLIMCKDVHTQAKDLYTALEKFGINVHIGTKYMFDYIKPSVINKYDAIVFMDSAHYIMDLTDYGGLVFNHTSHTGICDDKLAFAYYGQKWGCPTIPTYMQPLKTFPQIAKPRAGSLGRGVFKIDSKEELMNLPKEKTGYIYQPFITTSIGTDYRVVVIGGKVVACEKRYNPNDFRSNLATGGEALAEDPPYRYKVAAMNMAKRMQIDFVGFDIMKGQRDDEPLICEANSKPMKDGILKCRGINIYDKYAEYIQMCLDYGYKK